MTIKLCWENADRSYSSSTSESPQHGLLSTEGHLVWPAGYVAAVSKVLDDTGVPNFIWGDFLNALWGSSQLPMSSGYIIPRHRFTAAISAITAAGLRPCPCETWQHYSAREGTTSLLAHFVVPELYGVIHLVYLCPSDLFLNLIPLTPSHPNPADIRFVKLNINLRDTENPLREGKEEDMHAIKVLTSQSLKKILLLLSVFSPPTCRGFIFTFELSLAMLYQADRTCDDLGSRSLDELRAFMFKGLANPEERRMRKGNVKAEWRSRLTLCKSAIRQ